MSSHRTIRILCDQCRIEIICDGFEKIPEARREAKRLGYLKVYKVQNGALWDFCPKCALEYKNN